MRACAYAEPAAARFVCRIYTRARAIARESTINEAGSSSCAKVEGIVTPCSYAYDMLATARLIGERAYTNMHYHKFQDKTGYLANYIGCWSTFFF